MALNPRLNNWSRQTAWLIGASSGLGRATASKLHELGARVIVSARTQTALEDFVSGHPGAEFIVLDTTDMAALRAAAVRIGPVDLAGYFAGMYTPMRATAFDLEVAVRHQHINYIGALAMIDAVLPGMLARRRGHISLVSSVAGYRGLPWSLAYGPTKAALINLAETLYLDLQPQGLGVSIINPGFVKTRLTEHNHFHMPALITPEQAANEILRGWAQGRFEIHFPKRFTLWLKAMQHLPYAMYFAAVRRVTGL